MRATPIPHGIRGIFPLVRLLAPQAISSPFALAALRGIRLAIDATLLVQRLHFADDPHPSRHVIGFYRLVTSLRQHGVAPLMVFDHPHKRLALKDREQVKRRHKRELDRIRSRLEHERRGRLQVLRAHLDTLASLQERERRQVGELLDQWRTHATSQPSSSTAPPPSPTFEPPSLPPAPTKPQSVAYSMHTNWMHLEESLRSGSANQSKGQKLLAEAEQQVYQTIAMQLMSGQAPQPLPSLAAGLDATGTEADVDASHPLSSLNAMHHSLTKTYQRATSPLSASIYQHCATLCSLMAVPVFWTGDGTRTGGGRIHEAEAYAASLVRSGFADLVASEDSDVLLYEAPLLRGLMGGVRNPDVLGREGARGKLEVVCGTRVRRGLFPKSEIEKLPGLHSEVAKVDGDGGEDGYDRMTRALMLDFALLCGTDFNRTVPGIGPKTALRLLKEHGSISTILRKEATKFRPPDGLSLREYETELRHARSVFLQPPKVRAAARSILGTAVSEAAADVAAQQAASASVQRVLFPDDAPRTGLAASDHVDAEANSYCTAESADLSGNETIETISSDVVSGTSTSAAVGPMAAEVAVAAAEYDRQKVHDFLRSHGVFRSSSSLASPLGEDEFEFDSSLAREQEWRDLLDLELGLTSSASTQASTSATTPEHHDEPQVASLGSDFFGERKARVASWNPHLEQQLRQETDAPLHHHYHHHPPSSCS